MIDFCLLLITVTISVLYGYEKGSNDVGKLLVDTHKVKDDFINNLVNELTNK